MTTGSNHFSFATSYTIKPNDTLSTIAEHFWGHAEEWPAIYNYRPNKETIGDDPNLIRSGQSLFIPGRYVAQPNDTVATITVQYFGNTADRGWPFWLDATYQTNLGDNLDTHVNPGQILYITAPGRYVVQPNDTLTFIAKIAYGKEALWDSIYYDNQSVIGANPNLIKPGQILYIEQDGGESGHGP
jgi:nucleoid-associated protein YgaU